MPVPSFMPSDDTRRALLQDAESDVGHVRRTVKSVWSGFIDFALRDNVLEVATGLV
jgi:large conductance mechanosensitive channel